MVETQVLVKNVPVLKTGIFGAYYMGMLGIIFGIIIGVMTMMKNFGMGLVILIGFPILTTICGFLLFLLIGYGTRIGLGFCNGYQITVENEKGTVTWKKLDVIKGAILNAFQYVVVAFPLSLIAGGITAIANVGVGLAIIIGFPILAFIFGFIYGALKTFGTSAGLSIAGGLPINIDSINGKTTFKGTSAVKYGIVTAVDMFVIMVVVSFFLLIFALMIPSTIPQTGSSALMLNSLTNIMLAAKGVLLILVVLLPIVGIILGFISGLLAGFGLNLACKATKGFEVEMLVQSAKITLQKMGLVKTGIFVAVYFTICSLISIFAQSMLQLLIGQVGIALFVFVFGIIQVLIIGGIMGLITAVSVNRINGYDIEGENLDKLVGA